MTMLIRLYLLYLACGIIVSAVRKSALDEQSPEGSASIAAVIAKCDSTEPDDDEEAAPLENADQTCWNNCQKRQGWCSWCGPKGACCRAGFANSPAECGTNLVPGGIGGLEHHQCVLGVSSPEVGLDDASSNVDPASVQHIKVPWHGQEEAEFDANFFAADDEVDGFSRPNPATACPRRSKAERIELVSKLWTLVENGVMHQDEFESQVEDCNISPCRHEQLAQLVFMQEYLAQDDGEAACMDTEWKYVPIEGRSATKTSLPTSPTEVQLLDCEESADGKHHDCTVAVESVAVRNSADLDDKDASQKLYRYELLRGFLEGNFLKVKLPKEVDVSRIRYLPVNVKDDTRDFMICERYFGENNAECTVTAHNIRVLKSMDLDDEDGTSFSLGEVIPGVLIGDAEWLQFRASEDPEEVDKEAEKAVMLQQACLEDARVRQKNALFTFNLPSLHSPQLQTPSSPSSQLQTLGQEVEEDVRRNSPDGDDDALDSEMLAEHAEQVQADEQCHCPKGGDRVTEDQLSKLVNAGSGKRTNDNAHQSVRDAAIKFCNDVEEKQNKSVFLVAGYHSGCSTEAPGYCCTPVDTAWQKEQLIKKKREVIDDSILHIAEIMEAVISSSEDIKDKVEEAVKTLHHINMEQKVMLHKLYLVHYHHAMLLMHKHHYCYTDATHLSACGDAPKFLQALMEAWRKLKANALGISGLVTCMKWGIRPLKEELNVLGRSRLHKGLHIVANVLWRSVYYVGSGQFLRGFWNIGVSFGRAVWRYRFELLIAGTLIMHTPALMSAITATGVTTGAASSFSLVFEQLIRNVVLALGCELLQSPLAMSMLIRWVMAKVVLHDSFIENVIKPLWATMSMGGVTGVVRGAVGKTAGGAGQIFKAIRERLASANEKAEADNEADATNKNVKKAWVDVAREFHETKMCDALYLLFAMWIGQVWRSLATIACAVMTSTNSALNYAETGIVAGTKKTTGALSFLSRKFSQSVKFMNGDKSGDLINQMAKTDQLLDAGSRNLIPRHLKLLHDAVGKVRLVGEVVDEKVLDSLSGALNVVTESSLIGGSLAGLFSWLFRMFISPEPKHIAVHDESLHMLVGKTKVDFNSHTCVGKKTFEKCLYLNDAGTEGEEVIMGMCCLASCRPEGYSCQGEVVDGDHWNPTAKLSDLESQFRILGGLVQLSRKSYGKKCMDPNIARQIYREEHGLAMDPNMTGRQQVLWSNRDFRNS